MEDHIKPDKKLVYDLNKLCLNLHSCLVNLPDELISSVNKVYLSSLLHPVLNLFIKSNFDEDIINAFNSEYIKNWPSFKIHNNVIWDIFRTFKRFKDIVKDSTDTELACKICNASIRSTELSLFDHMSKCKLSKNHDVFMEKAVTDFNPEKKNYTFGYYCEFCETYFRQSNTSFCSYSYAKTLHSKVCKGLKGDRTEVNWVYCEPCRIELCGDNVLELHKETIGHKIIEFNFKNIGQNDEPEDGCIDLKTAEYNFMMKYIEDIKEAVPSSSGVDVSETEAVAGAQVMSNLNGESNSYQENHDHNVEVKTYRDFMLEVVKKTIENKANSNYNGYFCDFCQIWSFSFDKFTSHINCSEHNFKLSETCVQINSCLICKLFIVGNDKTFGNHLMSDEHLTLKYIFETDDKVNNDLNTFAVEKNSDDENNKAEYYESDSSDSDDNNDENEREIKKIQYAQFDKPGKSTTNLRKSMSVSRESVSSVQSNSSNHNKNRTRKKFVRGKMNILDKELDKTVVRRTSVVVSDFPLTSTRKDIFDAFRSYGHIDDLRFDKQNTSAVVTFQKKLIADLLLQSNTSIFINGMKVKLEKQVSYDSVQSSDKEARRPLPDILKTHYKSRETFNAMMSDILIESIKEEMALEKSDGKMLLKNDLEETFRKEVKIVGSYGNGLALSSSSFDVYVDFGDDYSGKKIPDSLALAETAGELKYVLKNSNKDKLKDMNVCNKGSPVLCMNSEEGHICNIFFTNGLVDQNTLLIKTYLGSDLRVKDTILIIKKWMSVTNIMNPTGLSGYAITWMVLFYLMADTQNPIIPPVIALRNKNDSGNFIRGWNCCFTSDSSVLPKSKNKKPVQQLVYEFFKYYSDDDHLKYILCPLTGERIRKIKFKELDLPNAYRSYKFNLMKRTINEKFPSTGGLCLQDPFQLNCNLTYTLQGSSLFNFKWMCKEMIKLCQPWAEKQV